MTRNILYPLVALFLFFTGCTDDDWAAEKNSSTGKVRIPLEFAGEEIVMTRSVASSNERHIGADSYMLLFASDGSCKHIEPLSSGTLNPDSGETVSASYTTSASINNGDKVVFLANTGIPATNMPAKGTISYSTINSAFPSTNWNINQAGSDSGKGMPMSGEIVWSANPPTLYLSRSVAKIEVRVSEDIAGNDITHVFSKNNLNVIKWTVYNYAEQGNIYSIGGDSFNPLNVANTFFKVDDFTTLAFDQRLSSAKNVTDRQKYFYLPEYNSSVKAKLTTVAKNKYHRDRTCILIEASDASITAGNYGYYRLDLVEGNGMDKDKQFLNIKRNYHYKVTIHKVGSFGYRTVAEALAAPSGNIEYTIESTLNDAMSNGQYALEVDAVDNVLFYGDDTPVTLAKIKSTFADVNTSASDISNNNVTINKYGGDLLFEFENIPGGRITEDAQEIILKSVTSQNTTGGGTATIELTAIFGNLRYSKKITVIKNEAMDAHPDRKIVDGTLAGVTYIRNDDGIEITDNMDGTLTIDVEDNTIPVGWKRRNSDGSYSPSYAGDAAAIPVFQTRAIDGILTDDDGRRTLLHIVQKAPLYGAYYGSPLNPDLVTKDSRGFAKKRFVVESVEEMTQISWATEQRQYYTKFKEYDDGLAITKYLKDDPTATAVQYCIMKNDLNHNGIIDSDEPILWYLPAERQLAGILTMYGVISPGISQVTLWGTLWSATESESGIAGYISFDEDMMQYKAFTEKRGVRCVKDIN